MLKNTKLVLALSIIPQIILIKLLSKFPQFVEDFYSNGIYVFISKAMRYVFGWLPFSFGDIFYTILVILLLRWLFINRKRIRQDTRNWCIDVAAAFSVIYFTFHVLWGFNYYRQPVHELINLDNKYDTETLTRVTSALINKANSLHLEITNNDTLKVTMPYTKGELMQMTSNGYKALSETYTSFNPLPVSTKASLYSLPLTYMGFSGYLNPFTNEAQIDDLIPLYQMPTTITHEQAHQIGYAAENEANFIGCLAALHNDDMYFKYSGYVFAVRYCLNELYRRDKAIHENLTKKVNIGILKNYEESYAFWNSYQNPLNPVFHSIYNTFLKANNQDKGIESYSYVVALFVNYFENKTL